MAANNEALALAGRAPMLSRTHPRSPTDGGCACCNPEPTGKARIATLRCLAIQLGASLATRSNPLINTDAINNYRIDGIPEHAEKEFLRYGIDHLMKLVKDAQPSD